MEYYLIHNKARYLIGELSFKTFWVTGGGWDILARWIRTQDSSLNSASVKTTHNKQLTIDEFLAEIQQFRINI